MHTDNAAAVPARPAHILLLKECLHAAQFDRIEVIDHAHVVFGPIPLIQLFEPFTRELVAFIAITGGIVLYGLAVSNNALLAVAPLICVFSAAP